VAELLAVLEAVSLELAVAELEAVSEELAVCTGMAQDARGAGAGEGECSATVGLE
jgi:hypothetical protein